MAKLSPLDQIVLAAVAHERSVFAKLSLERYAACLGVEKVTPRAVQGAIARLRDEQLIYQLRRGTYRVNNSVFADWLRETMPQIADLHTVPPVTEFAPGTIVLPISPNGLRGR